MLVRSGRRRDLLEGPVLEDDLHQDLLVQNAMPKTTPTTIADTPTAIPTFAPVLNPLSLLSRSVLLEGDSVDVGVGRGDEEEVAEAGVVLSDGGVTVMTVYVAAEVEGLAPSIEVVADVLSAADGAEVWLHCPLPLESV
jgi:hypothetical protein